MSSQIKKVIDNNLYYKQYFQIDGKERKYPAKYISFVSIFVISFSFLKHFLGVRTC